MLRRKHLVIVVAATMVATMAMGGVVVPAPALAADPVEATAGTAVLAVSAGAYHTCAIRTDGTLACWGSDEDGQATPPAGTFGAVSAGWGHTCAIRTDGTLACWRADSDQATPPAGTFSAVSAGGIHTCAIQSDDTLACWGYDEDGQATPPAGTFRAVSAGLHHTCAIRSDDTLACWGYDGNGQATPPAGTFSAVDAGDWHTCAIRTDGTLACWGVDSDQATPPAGTFSAVSAGDVHNCAIRTDGTLACWGMGSDQATPPAGTFSAVSAGGGHTCAIRTDGTLACWGCDEYGQATPVPDPWMTSLPRWSRSTDLPLAWTARPRLEPVASYDVRYRRARWNGAFGDRITWRSGTTDTAATFHAAPGSTYCFSARARDAAGVVSPWAGEVDPYLAPETCTAVPLDDRSLTRSGSWTAGTSTAYFRGTYLRSRSYGARLTRTGVEARRIALVATTCPTCGTVKVYLGTRLLKTISLHSDTTVIGKIIPVKSWSALHSGTVMIRVVSSGKKVIIDGLAISRLR
jgi:alpha-tubulin suppressor-like RCC1 family protein